MTNDIILSTTNSTKALEIGKIFAQSPFRLLTLRDVGITGSVQEGDKSLEENARLKALFAWKADGGRHSAMADDTGIFIRTLGGEPGVRSARWAGEGATTEQTQQYCLDRMRGVLDRRATFRTAVVFVDQAGAEHVFTGELEGHLLDAPRVAPRPMMPYSALFVPEGREQALAEMSVADENEISHRGQAFRKLREFLEA